MLPMVLQDERNGCGAATLVNTLAALGSPLDQRDAKRLAGTSFDGTDPDKINTALKKLGFATEKIRERSPAAAIAALRGHLLAGHPVMLAVADWDHYVVAVGIMGDRIVVVDSADGSVVRVWPSDKFVDWWGCEGEVKPYFGVAVFPADQ